jgi:hypothetical protein
VLIDVVRRVMIEGFLVSPAGFPATPVNLSCLRVSLSVRHSDEQIVALVRAIRRQLEAVLDEHQQSLDEIIARLRSVPSFAPPPIHLTRG